jgi:SAM-dependent methyltransferase
MKPAASTADQSTTGAASSPELTDYRAYVGPADQYDFMGATQFRLLATLGLREGHYLLDIGCGSLRAGRLLIPYLLPDRYHGLEPNKSLIDEAVANEVGEDMIRIKRPRFAYNDAFDYAEFGRRFDFILAQSILSHTGADLALRALSRLPAVMHSTTIALVTFKAAPKGAAPAPSSGWVYPGVVEYDEPTIASLIAQSGLAGARLPWFHPRQVWYFLALERKLLPSSGELKALTGRVLRDERFAGAAEAGRQPSVLRRLRGLVGRFLYRRP